jgi:hypothetical protein
MYTVTTIINGQRVEVEATAASILLAAEAIERDLRNQTQNLMVFAADAYNHVDGRTERAVGIRKVDKVGGPETEARTSGLPWLIAGTLRQIDNDDEIVRIRDLMMIGYQNAYVDLRSQALYGGLLAQVELGPRKIVDMQIVGERAYLTLAPIG